MSSSLMTLVVGVVVASIPVTQMAESAETRSRWDAAERLLPATASHAPAAEGRCCCWDAEENGLRVKDGCEFCTLTVSSQNVASVFRHFREGGEEEGTGKYTHASFTTTTEGNYTSNCYAKKQFMMPLTWKVMTAPMNPSQLLNLESLT